ncbi:MAG: hypothetical protein ABI647_18720 [Gemmatimonadota bacterium]
MPWKLIAKAFGWRATFDIVAARPTLIVQHPSHARRFSGTNAWKQAVLVSIHAPARSFSRKEP